MYIIHENLKFFSGDELSRFIIKIYYLCAIAFKEKIYYHVDYG